MVIGVAEATLAVEAAIPAADHRSVETEVGDHRSVVVLPLLAVVHHSVAIRVADPALEVEAATQEADLVAVKVEAEASIR